jgi:RNA polymerase sigma factor (sigma-70 family)
MAIAEQTREDEIVVAAIRGSDEAFSRIYDLLSVRVFNFVLRSVHERSTAEDICQEVWIKAHRELRSLKSPQALRTWLFRMASRACIDYSRSRAYRERGSPEVTEEMLDSPSDEPETVALRRSELRSMWEALAALPARQSMALYLKQVDGCSYEEISRVLGCPRSAVETLLFRARHGLVRTRERFQADPKASCKMISTTMSVVLDKEGTPIQQRAIDAHISECKDCREELSGMKRGVAGYAWLPMLPVGGQALTAALAGGATGAAAGFGIGRFFGMLAVKGQASGLIAALTVGAVATTAAAASAAGLAPSPADAFGTAQDVGVAIRSATIGGGGGDETAVLKADDPNGGGTLSTLQSPPLAPGTNQSLPPASPLLQPPVSLPPAGQLDPQSALSGLPGLLQSASDGTLSTVEPLLAFVQETVDGVLQDPLGTLQELLDNPGDTVDALAGDLTDTVNQTTQNATQTVDDTVDQTTDIVDGVLGNDAITQPVDDVVDSTTDVVDQTVTDVTDTVDDTVDDTTDIVDDTTDVIDDTTDVVDDTTDTVDDTLEDVLGDDGILGGDDGLLGGLGGGGSSGGSTDDTSGSTDDTSGGTGDDTGGSGGGGCLLILC